MYIYRLDVRNNDGTFVMWSSSKAEANRDRAEFKRDYGKEECFGTDITLCNIPAGKTGLIKWLNANLNTNNG